MRPSILHAESPDDLPKLLRNQIAESMMMMEIEKLFPEVEPLSAAESLVAEYYTKNGWDVASVKGCMEHIVLWCDYFRSGDVKDVETHIVSVEEYTGELHGVHNFQRMDFQGESKNRFKDPTQVHAIVSSDGKIKLFEVGENEVLDLILPRRRHRSSGAEVRREREVLVLEKR